MKGNSCNFSNINKCMKIFIFVILFMLLIESQVYASPKNVFKEENISTSKVFFAIKFNTAYDLNSVNDSSIYLLQDSTGRKIACEYFFSDDNTVVLGINKRLKVKEKYTLVVTNDVLAAKGKKPLKIQAQRTFNVNEELVIDKVLDVPDITVMQGEKPKFPRAIDVVYKDGSKGKEFVNWTWNSSYSNYVGKRRVYGRIIGLNKSATINVEVKAKEYIKDISHDFFPILGNYLINVKVDDDVCKVTLNGSPMHYKGNNIFQLSTLLLRGHNITLNVYDGSGRRLATKKFLVED